MVCFLWEITVGHKSLAWQTVPLCFRIHNGVWCDRLTSELLCWGSKATRGMIMRLKWIDKPGENKSYTITTYKLHCAYILDHVDHKSWFMFSTMFAGDIVPPRCVKRTSIIIMKYHKDTHALGANISTMIWHHLSLITSIALIDSRF